MGFSLGYAFLALQAVPLRRKKGPLAKSVRPVLIEKTFRKKLANVRVFFLNVQTPDVTLVNLVAGEAHGSQDGIQPSAAEVFDRSLLATSETFPPLFYGALQPIRNLLGFPQIDSEVFRSRTRGERFDGVQRNRGSLTVFSYALHYDVPAHISSRLGLRASEP